MQEQYQLKQIEHESKMQEQAMTFQAKLVQDSWSQNVCKAAAAESPIPNNINAAKPALSSRAIQKDELVCGDGYVLPMLLSQRNPDQLLLMLANRLVLCERMHFPLAANLVRKGTDASHKCCAVQNTPLQLSLQALGCLLYMGHLLCTICLSI